MISGFGRRATGESPRSSRLGVAGRPVPVDMRAAVGERLPGSASITRRGTAGLDLRAGVAAQLAALGVVRVVADPRCTVEDPELYSYRRDRVTGRQAGLIWIEPGVTL